MGTDIAKYSEFDLPALDEVDKTASSIGTGKVWRFEQGENIVRFLPARAGQPGSAAFRVTAVHYVDPAPGMDKQVVFNCPRVEKVGDCIVCNRAQELAQTGNPVDRKLGDKLSPRMTVFANVLDRDQPDAGPRAVQFGRGVWDDLKRIRKSRTGGNFTDPGSKGFDIVITKTGSKLDTEYSVSPDRNSRPACEEAAEFADVMARCADLNAFVRTEVPEELIQAYAAVARAGRGQSQSRAGAGRGRSAVSDARGEDPFADSDEDA